MIDKRVYRGDYSRRARSQVQNFEGAMELFGGAKIVAGKVRRCEPGGGSGGSFAENSEKSAVHNLELPQAEY